MSYLNIKKFTLNIKQHLALILSLHLILLPLNLSALPTGQSVAAGTATFSEVASTLSITTSNKAIINYSSFNIGASESVNFIQPSASSVVLNRVAVGNPSSILGSLNANGNVFLLNPSGMFFGANSSINTNSFVASTLNLSDSDFLSGNFQFNKLSDVASSYIVQKGNITVSDQGFVILASPFVSSEGSIIAKSGNIVIGANDNFYLEFDSAGLVKYEYEQATVSDDPILISKDHANSVIDSILNTDELNESIEFVQDGDSYELIGANNTALVSGTLNTDATDSLEAGTIEIKAQNDVFILDNAILQSNANTNGYGGTIDIYANDLAYSANNASYLAKGGSISGDGGFAELSATKTVILDGSNINLSAQNGANGTFYIDPEDVVVSSNEIAYGTDIEIVADNSITVNDNVTISSRNIDASESDYLEAQSIGDSGNITLTSQNITIGDNSQILSFADGTYASGDITLEATSTGTSEASSSITLNGSFIKGGNISILATANSVDTFNSLTVIEDIASLVYIDSLSDFSEAAYAKAEANAIINIDNSNIIGDSINIQSNASSDTSATTIMEGVGIAYSKSIANANTNIENNSTLTSNGTIDIGSNVDSSNEVSVYTVALGTSRDSDFNISAAFAQTDTTSTVNIDNSSTITSVDQLNVDANTSKSISASSTAGSYADGTLATALSVTESESTTTASVGGDIDVGALDISAKTTNNAIKTTSSSVVGTGKLTGYVLTPLTTVSSQLSGFEKGASTTTLAVSGAISYSDHLNTTIASINNESDISISGETKIDAQTEYLIDATKGIQTFANASVNSNSTDKKEFSVAGAAVYTNIGTTTKAYIGENVTLNSDEDIIINASTSMPYTQTYTDIDSATDIIDKLNGTLGVKDGFFTTWAKSSSKGDVVGVAGTVNIFNMVNDTEAYIDENTYINQDSASYGNLSIKASSNIETVNLSGVFGFGLSGGGDAGIGGAAIDVTYTNNTLASINTGSNVKADSLDLEADTDTQNISLSVSGTKATKFSAAGTYSNLTMNNTTKSTISGSNIELTDGTDAILNLLASDTSYLHNYSGGISKSASVGIGTSVSFSDITRTTETLIEDTIFNTQGNINLDSYNKGGIYSVSIAGAAVSEETPSEDDIKEGKNSSGKFGLTVSGASAVNEITDTSSSIIKNSKSSSDSEINLNAKNNTDIYSLTGAAAVTLKTTSAGLAGAYSQNTLNNETITSISNSELSASNVVLDSQNLGEINAISAGGAVTTGSISLSLAGSVAINEINNDTQASIEESNIYTNDDLKLNAYNNTTINTFAGALSIASTAGVGAAYTQNDISNTSQAYINASNIESEGIIDIDAKDESTINIIAAAISAATTGMAASGSVAINNIANTIEAYILGSSSEDNVITANEDITLDAEDNSTIIAYGGGLAGGSSAAVGATVLYNTITNNINSYIKDVFSIESQESINLKSLSVKTIDDTVVSGAASAGFSASGTVIINTIKDTMESYVENSTLLSKDSISINAEENNTITILGGALSIGSTAGMGGILAINNIKNTINAYIKDSGITAYSDLAVTSMVTEAITTKLANLSGGGSGALAATALINNINDNVESYIQSSKINEDNTNALNTQDVTVSAETNDVIDSLIGGLAAGGTAGIGASVETSNISNNTNAYIKDSTVYSKNKASVESTSEEKIDSIVVSGGISGLLSVAGSVSIINVDNANDAYISNSNIYSDKDIEISSQDNTYLGEEDALLVGSVALSGGVGVGGSVVVTNIAQDVSAYAEDSDINAKENITITANSIADISTEAATLSVGSYAGAAGAVTINTIDSNTQAYTSDININQEEDYKGSSSQSVSILADSTNTIDSLPGSISASAGASASGSVDLATIYNTTSANLGSNTTLYSGGDLSVEAKSTKNVSSTVIAGSGGLAGGIAGGLSIININSNISSDSIDELNNTQEATNETLEGSLDTSSLGDSSTESSTKDDLDNIELSIDDEFNQDTNISKGVFASIGDDSSANVQGNTSIKATDDITTATISGTAAVGGLLGIGGSVNLVNIGSITEAYIGEKVILSTESLDIQSLLNTHITSNAYAAAAGGAVGVGAAVSILDIDYTNSAYIDESSDVDATNDLNIKATSDLTAASYASGAAVGAAAAGIVISSITQTGTTQAYVDDNNNIEATNITVEALSQSDLSSESFAGVGGLVAGGGSISSITANPTVNAYIGNDVIVDSSKDTSILAYANATLKSIAKGISAAVVAVGISEAIANWTVDVTSSVGENSTIDVANLTINAYINQDEYANNVTENTIKAKANGSSFAGIGGAGTLTRATNDSDINISIGDETTITASENIETNAKSYTNTRAISSGVSVGLASAGATESIATNNASVITSIQKATLSADEDISILSKSVNTSYAISSGAQGGGLAFGDTLATADVDNKANIILNSATLDAGENISLNADGRIDSTVITTNSSAGVYTNNKSKSILTINQKVKVKINGTSNITAKSIDIQAEVLSLDANSNSYTDTISGASNSTSTAQLTVTSDTDVMLNGSSSIRGAEEVNIRSLQDSVNLSSYAKSEVSGSSGALTSNSENQSNINSNLSSSTGSSITTNNLYIEASSANRTKDNYKNEAVTNANTIVSFVTETIDVLVKSVSWIPFFGSLIKWVSKKVTKVLEVITNSEISENRTGNYSSTSNLTLNGEIHQLVSDTQKLEISENDIITTEGDISASIIGDTIIVDSLINEDSSSITLISKSDAASIEGNATIYMSNSYEEVEITNNSNLNLELNNIDTINNDLTTPNIDITTYDNNSNFTFTSEKEAPILSIENLGTGDIILSGTINNETGSTTIYNEYGDVFSNNSSIITNSLDINADRGSLGTSTNYIDVEFAIDDAVDSTLISNSLYDTYLNISVSKLLNEDDVSSSYNVTGITLDEITADGKVNITLDKASVYNPESTSVNSLSTYIINNIFSSDDITINAQTGVSLELDGTIQSGITQRDITIDDSNPLESESKYISSISSDTITLTDIVQTGGNLSIDLQDGTLTGNGDINLLTDFTDINITNNNAKDLILNSIDTNNSVDGSFVLNGDTQDFGAYNNISINEIGNDTAGINIVSNNGGEVQLNSDILNKSGTTTISGNGNLSNLVDYKILADEISLNFGSSSSIGSSTNNIIINGNLSATANDDIYISSVNDLLINNIMADNIYLNSAGKIESLNTNTIDIQANTLELIATDKIGASNNFLDLSTNSLSATSTLEAINITNDKSLEIVNNGLLANKNIQLEVEGTLTQANDADIISTTKKVSLEASGNIILDFIQAATNVFINSKEGSIAENNDSDVDIISETLTLEAKHGIGNDKVIELSVNKLVLDNESSNNIELSNNKNLVLSNTNQEGGDFKLEVEGTLTQENSTDISSKGDINLIAVNDISLGNTSSDTNISITSTDGSFTQQDTSDIIAKGNIDIDALNDISLGNTSSNKNITLTSSDGSFIQDISSNISAIGNTIINTFSDISLGNTSSDASLNIESSAGSFTQQNDTNIFAKGNIDIEASKYILVGDITSQKKLSINTHDYLTQRNGTDITATEDIELIVGNDIFLGNTSSGSNLSIESSAGSFTQQEDTEIEATGNIGLLAVNEISLGDTSSGADLSINSTSGSFTQQDDTKITADGNIDIKASEYILVGNIESQKKLSINTQDYFTQRNGTNITATEDIELFATNDFSLGNTSSETNITIESSDGSLTQQNNTDIIAKGNIGITTLSDISLGNTSSSANLTIESSGSSFTQQDDTKIKATANIDLLTLNDIALGNTSTNSNLSINSTAGSFTQNDNTDIIARGNIDISAFTDISLGNTVSETSLSIKAKNGTFTQQNNTNISSKGAMSLEASNNIILGDLSSNSSITLKSNNGAFTQTSGTNIYAKSDILVETLKNISIFDINSDNNITLHSKNGNISTSGSSSYGLSANNSLNIYADSGIVGSISSPMYVTEGKGGISIIANGIENYVSAMIVGYAAPENENIDEGLAVFDNRPVRGELIEDFYKATNSITSASSSAPSFVVSSNPSTVTSKGSSLVNMPDSSEASADSETESEEDSK